MSRSVRAIVALAVVAWSAAAIDRGLVAQDRLSFDPLAGLGATIGSPVKVEAEFKAATGGEAPVLVVTARIDDGWHLYSVDQKPGGPRPTRITVAPESPWLPAGPFKPDQAPHVRTVTDVPGWVGLQVEEHAGTVVWRAPMLANSAGSGDVITGAVNVQLCRDNSCSPPETFPFTTKVPVTAPNAGASAITDNDSPRDGRLPGVTSDRIATHVPPRSHAGVEAAFGPERPGVAGGGPAEPQLSSLVVRLTPEEGFHLYSPAGSADSEVGQGKPTVVAVTGADAQTTVVVLEATPAHSAELAAAKGVDGPVTFELRLPTAIAAGGAEIVIGFQTCTDTSCDPPTAVRLKATPSWASGTDAGVIEFGPAKYAEAAKKPVAIEFALLAPPPALAPPPVAVPTQVSEAQEPITASAPVEPSATSISAAPALPKAVIPKRLSLPMALLSGLLGGLILNLMPCVLPVLGLKLMSFAQQSGQARAEVFRTNLWYCAGVYAVFFALATASVAANIGLRDENLDWGEHFTSPYFSIPLAAIVFAFALALLGIWEIPIPGFIGEKAGHLQSKEGPLGAFLKGMLSTVLATPCSGPFLGPVFGFTLGQPTIVIYGVFGAIATGLALPYFLVALFPGLVKFLPKPGLWMETLKEIIGFVMLGTVVFLFTFIKHVFFVPTFALLVGIWAACWWIGKGQEKSGGPVGFGRWVQAAGVAAAIGFASFTFLGPVKSIIPWEPFSRARLTELRSSGATVLVDFSADWCMTCKLNLATAIETKKVKRAIASNRVVPLLADWTDESPEIKTMLESLQSRSIPVLAVFPATRPGEPVPEPIILRDLITESQVLTALKTAGPSHSGAAVPRSAAAVMPKGH